MTAPPTDAQRRDGAADHAEDVITWTDWKTRAGLLANVTDS